MHKIRRSVPRLWSTCLMCLLTSSVSWSDQATAENGTMDYEAEFERLLAGNRNGSVRDVDAGEEYEYRAEDDDTPQDETSGLVEWLMEDFLGSDADLTEKTPHEAWIAFGDLMEKIADRVYKTFFPRMMEISFELDLSSSCMGTLLDLVLALKKRKGWAMKVLDSWGKLPAGLLEGTVTDLGNYDQCLSITTDETEERRIDSFRPQYCMINVLPPLPPLTPDMTLKSQVFNFTNTRLEATVVEDASKIIHGLYKRGGRIGLCLPTDCSKEDLQKVIDKIADKIKFDVKVIHCDAKREINFDNTQVAALVIFSALIFIVALSTIFEVIQKSCKDRNKDSKNTNQREPPCLASFSTLCRSFSAVSNTEQLLDTNTSSASINVLCGIKVLSMFWLIFNHTYLVPHRTVYANSRQYLNVVEEFWFQGVTNGWVVVDTFFFMGALLFSYTCLHKIEKSGGRINYMRIVFNRFMRLCIPVWIVVLFVFIWPVIGSGPLWQEISEEQVSKCRDTWWATAIFISNWMTAKTICLQQTWYVSADLQLFLAFLPVLVIFYKYPKAGIASCILIINLGVVASGLNTYIPNTHPTPIYNILDYELVDQLIESTFLRTYLHMGPYALGIIVGYGLQKNRNVKLSKGTLVFGWITSAILCIASVWTTQPWNAGHPVEPITSLLYSSLHKTTWTIGVAWIIYACATGNGGWVDCFLSWKFFIVLSRLCYMLYLSHFYVIWTRQGILRERPYFSHYTMVCDFVVNCVFGLVVAYFLYLLVESPVSCLVRNYFSDAFQRAEIRMKKPLKIKEENVLNSRL